MTEIAVENIQQKDIIMLLVVNVFDKVYHTLLYLLLRQGD